VFYDVYLYNYAAEPEFLFYLNKNLYNQA
jgi:hypothetical protein